MSARLPESKVVELRKVFSGNFGDKLAGLILYGSALGPDYLPERSDVNILAVLERVDLADPEYTRLSFRTWLAENRCSVLYLSKEEARRSQDVFPMEFLEMQSRRRILCGQDFLAGLVIEPTNLRHQIEYELRGGLLALRGLLVGGAQGPLLQSGLDSAFNSVIILLKSLLRLEQEDVPEDSGEIIRRACARRGLDPLSVERVLALRREGLSGKPDLRAAAHGLHDWLVKLLEWVDSYWEKVPPATGSRS